MVVVAVMVAVMVGMCQGGMQGPRDNQYGTQDVMFSEFSFLTLGCRTNHKWALILWNLTLFRVKYDTFFYEPRIGVYEHAATSRQPIRRT